MPNSAHILMVDPAFFDVHYAINPWMRPELWSTDDVTLRAAARDSFTALRGTLEKIGCRVSTVDGVLDLPDMVFPANAAVVLDRRVLLSRFRHPQRQPEQAQFAAIFRALLPQGIIDSVDELPAECIQEGAGDCLWDAARGHFWFGWGPRSTLESAAEVGDFFQQRVLPLELVTERCYHLDVCFCPLEGGDILYYPPAFSSAAQAAIVAEVGEDKLIVASEEDLANFSVNTVSVSREVVMSGCSDALRDKLAQRGYRLHTVDVAPFMLAGGGVFCMTLRLDRHSQPVLLRSSKVKSAR
jgi:N-dimethylarginine dimethylaminohydrolase